jgi:hypothetical protein
MKLSLQLRSNTKTANPAIDRNVTSVGGLEVYRATQLLRSETVFSSKTGRSRQTDRTDVPLARSRDPHRRLTVERAGPCRFGFAQHRHPA